MKGARQATTVLLVIFLFWLLALWPPPSWFRTHWPAETAFMALREGQTKARRQYRPVPLDSIAPAMVEAVIIGEDSRFYTHSGIDYLALAQALGYPRQTFSWSEERDRSALLAVLPRAWSRRSRLRGASTITQQVAKNLYLSASRNPLRKVKEAVAAWRLELALDKSRIMELYLSIVELGPGTWGVEAASEVYFNRSARELTTGQAAALAGSLPFPLRSNPGYRPSRMQWRQGLILRRMAGEWVEVPKVAEEEAGPPDTTAAPDSIPEILDSLPVAPLDGPGDTAAPADSFPVFPTDSTPDSTPASPPDPA